MASVTGEREQVQDSALWRAALEAQQVATAHQNDVLDRVAVIIERLDRLVGASEPAADGRQQAEDRALWRATAEAQRTAAEFMGELAARQGDVLDKIAAWLEGPQGLLYQDAFRAGMESAQREACEAGPKYNTAWAAAMHLAVDRGRNQLTRSEVLDLAKWFYERLIAGPLAPEVPSPPWSAVVAGPDPTATRRRENALDLIRQFGGYDGAHHKQWVLDQVARILIADPDRYDTWRPEGWDEGIAP